MHLLSALTDGRILAVGGPPSRRLTSPQQQRAGRRVAAQRRERVGREAVEERRQALLCSNFELSQRPFQIEALRLGEGDGFRIFFLFDLLVVDEGSMINLAMMDRLLSALPNTVRLVLLGDAHQLPSVTAGNVLADLGRSPPGFSISVRSQLPSALGFDPVPRPAAPPEEVITTHDLQDAMVSLTQNYRFNTYEGIGRLAREVVSGINPTLTQIAPDTTLAEQHDADGSVVLSLLYTSDAADE